MVDTADGPAVAAPDGIVAGPGPVLPVAAVGLATIRWGGGGGVDVADGTGDGPAGPACCPTSGKPGTRTLDAPDTATTSSAIVATRMPARLIPTIFVRRRRLPERSTNTGFSRCGRIRCAGIVTFSCRQPYVGSYGCWPARLGRLGRRRAVSAGGSGYRGMVTDPRCEHAANADDVGGRRGMSSSAKAAPIAPTWNGSPRISQPPEFLCGTTTTSRWAHSPTESSLRLTSVS
jgi:hypothetical protein